VSGPSRGDGADGHGAVPEPPADQVQVFGLEGRFHRFGVDRHQKELEVSRSAYLVLEDGLMPRCQSVEPLMGVRRRGADDVPGQGGYPEL